MSLIIEHVDTFKHILRILNTNIEGTRTVPYAIEAIKGVGRRFGYLICKILRINPRLRAGNKEVTQVN
jgi:small subunit ribosomal protein S18e